MPLCPDEFIAPFSVGLVVVVRLTALPPTSFAERFPFGLGITLLTVYTGTRRG